MGMSRRPLDEIVAKVNRLGYEILDPGTTAAGLAMIIIGAIEMIASVVLRAAVICRHKGPGPWILEAVWDTAFKIALLPIQWAAERGQQGGEAVSCRMMERVGEVESSAAGEVPVFFTKSADRSAGECRSGQATPAVQRGSVPRMLLFGLYSSK